MMKTRPCIVVNPGHTPSTPGKRSPDRTVLEWKWNRDVATIVVDKLIELGFLVAEAKTDNESESLTAPVRIANNCCRKYGTDNVLFVSIHVNAAGNGDWKNARGWSIWTTKGKTKSDALAECLWQAAHRMLPPEHVKTQRSDMSDGDHDYESDFYVLRKTLCPAVLVEHFFMDNKQDVEYLKTAACKNMCANIIVQGILNYLA